MGLTSLSVRSLMIVASLVVASDAAHAALAQASAAQSPQAGSSPQVPTASPATEVPSDYVIGAEDVLGVLFWREPEMSGDVTVRPDGMVTLPLIGEIKPIGMTPEQFRVRVKTAADKFLADANVTVVVRQINSRKIYITGQVAHPGAFPLTGPRTVLQLIALAGGLGEYAEVEKITIMRVDESGTKTFKFNYRDVTRGKSLDQNILLKPGDTVVVP